jgi:hypothetical protein
MYSHEETCIKAVGENCNERETIVVTLSNSTGYLENLGKCLLMGLLS